jgi:hypothetical protein
VASILLALVVHLSEGSRSMRRSLDDARNKLRRANDYFEVLRPQIEAFEGRNTHKIRVEIDAETGKYVFRIDYLEAPDPEWGLILGDCVHNARAALDHIVVHLYALATGGDPLAVEGVGFPIYGKRERFQKWVKGKNLDTVAGFSGYLARFEELQPFNKRNPSIWGFGHGPGVQLLLPELLAFLSRLDNIDKHRGIHPVWNCIMNNRRLSTVPPLETPDGFFHIERDRVENSLEDGAVVATYGYRTPLPCLWEPSEVEMQRQFPLHIALTDTPFRQGVLEIIPRCLVAVDSVLKIFGGVFDGPGTPLPVTAVTSIP